ncbi:MAG: cobalt transporter CbiM [Actinomycetota bacterium]
MHIPDGYLSPATCAVAGGLALPAVRSALHRARKSVGPRRVSLLALGAAFSFLIMMFNLPVPGGTSAHAVGAVAVAIALGPASAVVCITVALVIQALVFADGGILALGANILNMAVAMPLVGWGVYRLIAGGGEPSSRRRVAAAAAGGYAGINIAALLTGFEIGIQPLLFHTASGRALYSPYDLGQALPAMIVSHLTVAGFAEAAVTGLMIAYLLKANPALLDSTTPHKAPRLAAALPGRKLRTAFVGLGLLLVLTPIGLITTATAYGEGSAKDIAGEIGYAPKGIASAEKSIPRSPLADYALPGLPPVAGYLLSGALGAGLVAAGIAMPHWLRRRTRGTGPGARGDQTCS